MKALSRVWTAFLIACVETRIERRRELLAQESEGLNNDRRAVNALHHRLAVLQGRQHQPSIFQTGGR